MATTLDELKKTMGPAFDGAACEAKFERLLESLRYDEFSSDLAIVKRSNPAVRVVRQLLNGAKKSPCINCGDDGHYEFGHGNNVLANETRWRVELSLINAVDEIGLAPVIKMRDAPRPHPLGPTDVVEIGRTAHWRVVVTDTYDPRAPEPKRPARRRQTFQTRRPPTKRVKFEPPSDEFHVIVNKTRWFACDFVQDSTGRLLFAPEGRVVPQTAKVVLLGSSLHPAGKGMLDLLGDCVALVVEQSFEEAAAVESLERDGFTKRLEALRHTSKSSTGAMSSSTGTGDACTSSTTPISPLVRLGSTMAAISPPPITTRMTICDAPVPSETS